MLTHCVTISPFLKSQTFNTEEESSIVADTVDDCLGAVLMFADLGTVSSNSEEGVELYQASGGRTLFAI
jgi:hypothetical protein